jgi:hypothetical protein
MIKLRLSLLIRVSLYSGSGKHVFSEFLSPTRSWVWNNFLRADNGQAALAFCKLCKKEKGIDHVLQTNGGTSSMHHHLRNTHGITTNSPEALKGNTIDEDSGSGDSGPRVVEVEVKVKLPERKVRGRRPRSKIWNYFTKVTSEGQPVAKCELCEEEGQQRLFKQQNGTTTLLHNHLKNYHEIDLSKISYSDSEFREDARDQNPNPSDVYIPNTELEEMEEEDGSPPSNPTSTLNVAESADAESSKTFKSKACKFKCSPLIYDSSKSLV